VFNELLKLRDRDFRSESYASKARRGGGKMAKGYWVSVYRSVSNPEALTEYGKIAGPALTEAGGRLLVRGEAAVAYEGGIKGRVVILEFDSVEKAIAAHDSDAYQAALKVIAGAVDRDLRIVEGLE
jgi:uncharacterized protein (DUF1330 family)